MAKELVARDGSSKKKVLITSILFMGLSHIIRLKQYVKGIFFALIEMSTPTTKQKNITKKPTLPTEQVSGWHRDSSARSW